MNADFAKNTTQSYAYQFFLEIHMYLFTVRIKFVFLPSLPNNRYLVYLYPNLLQSSCLLRASWFWWKLIDEGPWGSYVNFLKKSQYIAKQKTFWNRYWVSRSKMDFCERGLRNKWPKNWKRTGWSLLRGIECSIFCGIEFHFHFSARTSSKWLAQLLLNAKSSLCETEILIAESHRFQRKISWAWKKKRWSKFTRFVNSLI